MTFVYEYMKMMCTNGQNEGSMKLLEQSQFGHPKQLRWFKASLHLSFNPV